LTFIFDMFYLTSMASKM